MQNFIIQGIGFVGLIFAIVSFQKNINKGILLFQALASFTFAIQFILLGAYTGAAMCLLSTIRNVIFFNRDSMWAKKKYLLYVFVLLYILVGVATYDNYFSIFSIIGMTLSTFGFWIKEPMYTRRISLICSPCFLVYNFASGSIAGVIAEIFVMLSLIIAMVRFDFIKITSLAQNGNSAN